MTESVKKKNGGISIRVVHIAMILCAAAIVLLLIISTWQSMQVFTTLSSETGNYIVRQKAAHDLMEASDYLTEMVQRFTLDGDTTFLNNYFEEAFVSKRREASITTMSENEAEQNLVQQLQEAMDESLALMYREYYAMRLVIEAREIQDYPETLRAIELKEEDSFLTSDEKMELAQNMVMSAEYYESKEIIRTKLKSTLETLDQLMLTTRQNTSAEMMRQLNAHRLFAILLTLVLIILIAMISYLVTLPLLKASKYMAKKEALPVAGAKEFRQLAGQYNEMADSLRQNE
jgi:hypothetical protein